MGPFELLNDFITMSYFSLPRRDMEVNEGKNWLTVDLEKLLF